jgi:hypothetical protein
VEFVFGSTIGYEAICVMISPHSRCSFFGYRYLLSSPPMFLTMFRREKTTPKMSLASSSLDRAFRPPTIVSSLLTVLISDCGRTPLVELEIGRGVHRREYTHSARVD